MKRPSKKDIKAAIDALKSPAEGNPDAPAAPVARPLGEKRSSNRIRKKGV